MLAGPHALLDHLHNLLVHFAEGRRRQHRMTLFKSKYRTDSGTLTATATLQVHELTTESLQLALHFIAHRWLIMKVKASSKKMHHTLHGQKYVDIGHYTRM